MKVKERVNCNSQTEIDAPSVCCTDSTILQSALTSTAVLLALDKPILIMLAASGYDRTHTAITAHTQRVHITAQVGVYIQMKNVTVRPPHVPRAERGVNLFSFAGFQEIQTPLWTMSNGLLASPGTRPSVSQPLTGVDAQAFDCVWTLLCLPVTLASHSCLLLRTAPPSTLTSHTRPYAPVFMTFHKRGAKA